jgi:hypothetical protein
MLVVFNPTDKELQEKLKIPMHYTGLRDRIEVRESRVEMGEQAGWQSVQISPQEMLEWDVIVPAYSMRAFEFSR